MLKLICTKCQHEYLCRNAEETSCPTCVYYETRKENYAALSKYNDALNDLATRLDFLKDNGLIREEEYQLGQLGLSYLQNAAH